MAQNTVSVGVIGAGNRADFHCRSIDTLPEADLVAVCDLDRGRAESTAAEFDAPHVYTDHERMLAEDAVDAVYVVTNPTYFPPLVVDVLEADKHLFVEKPPGLDVQQTRSWADLAEERGCKTAVGFQTRFHPLGVEARDRVEAESEIRYGSVTCHKNKTTTPVERLLAWMEADQPPRRLQNRLLIDAIHFVDLLVWMGDGIADVDGRLGHFFPDPEYYDPNHIDGYTATVQFENGGVGVMNSNFMAGGNKMAFEMHGKGVSAEIGMHAGPDGLDEHDCVIYEDGTRIDEGETLTVEDVDVPNVDPEIQEGTYQLTRDFITSIRNDDIPETNFRESTKAMQAVQDLLLSERAPPAFD